MTPFISIVMPVRNEARFIADTLSQLLSQDYPNDRFEILVVDGMSDDGTRDIVAQLAQKHRNLRLFENPKRLSSAGRNIGFRTGVGDYFLVVDGHCHIPDAQLLRNVSECFRKSGADCLGRPQPLTPPGLTRFQAAVALARSSALGHGSDSLIYSGIEGYCSPVSNGACYARHVFEKVGFVDETFDAAEDVEFNRRLEKAGLRCYMSPMLTVKYYPRADLGSLFRQMMRYGKGRCRFIQKHHDTLTLSQLVPPAFVAGFLSLSLLSLWSLFWETTPALQVLALLYGLYLLAVLGESVRLALFLGGYLPSLPVIFFTIHFGLGWGFWLEGADSLRWFFVGERSDD